MHSHPHYDLLLHDDDELAALLGAAIVERTTLHEWPLSCVQRISLADERTCFYKAQAMFGVEPLFYVRARSPVLVNCQLVPIPDHAPALLLEDIAAPRLIDLHPSEAETVRMGRELLGQIAAIRGDLPVDADISGSGHWSQYVENLLANLAALVEEGIFHAVNDAHIATITRLAQSRSVRTAIQSPGGLVHRDLGGDNVLVAPDGYRILDWQRVIWGPPDLDLATLLDSLGYDPRPYVAPGIMPLLYLLRIAWFATCARTWFPAGADFYDAAIVRLVEQAHDAE